MKKQDRMVVALSGGVDSAAAAAVLKKRGWDVTGVHLCFGTPFKSRPVAPCACRGGSGELSEIAAGIGIPLRILDFHDLFARTVIQYFTDSYLAGLTPNPCVVCNRAIKFGALLDFAASIGADRISTGHYARCEKDEGSGLHVLSKALDTEKDQSYFLYSLRQEQLARAVFPLGTMTKQKTRQLARSLGLKTADTPPSRDICFLGKSADYRQFLRKACPELITPGPIMNQDGRVIGHHEGTAFFTIGQRKGIRVAAKHPLYVVNIDPSKHAVMVGPRTALGNAHVEVREVNWLLDRAPSGTLDLMVRLRYRQKEVPARVSAAPDGRATVEFVSRQSAVAPGQSAVFYDGDRVVGGGIIEKPDQH